MLRYHSRGTRHFSTCDWFKLPPLRTSGTLPPRFSALPPGLIGPAEMAPPSPRNPGRKVGARVASPQRSILRFGTAQSTPKNTDGRCCNHVYWPHRYILLKFSRDAKL